MRVAHDLPSFLSNVGVRGIDAAIAAFKEVASPFAFAEVDARARSSCSMKPSSLNRERLMPCCRRRDVAHRVAALSASLSVLARGRLWLLQETGEQAAPRVDAMWFRAGASVSRGRARPSEVAGKLVGPVQGHGSAILVVFVRACLLASGRPPSGDRSAGAAAQLERVFGFGPSIEIRPLLGGVCGPISKPTVERRGGCISYPPLCSRLEWRSRRISRRSTRATGRRLRAF